ncbi:hypothetical protein JHK87_053006 [Glycine soja]|nr:hypothetical protein JHK87_053005 [Glycine soja]KAG4915449.1 hypothetical protein JHK87_053006 [Glycine soja]
MDTPLKQQPSLGENLENFLAPAGVINVGDHQDHNVNVVIGGDTHHQDLMGMDPMKIQQFKEHINRLEKEKCNLQKMQLKKLKIKILYGLNEIKTEFGIGTGTGGKHCFLGRKNN